MTNMNVADMAQKLKALRETIEKLSAESDNIQSIIELHNHVFQNPLSLTMKAQSPLTDAIIKLLPKNEADLYWPKVNQVYPPNNPLSSTNDSWHLSQYKGIAQNRITILNKLLSELTIKISQAKKEMDNLYASDPVAAEQAHAQLNQGSGTTTIIILAVLAIAGYFIFKKIF